MSMANCKADMFIRQKSRPSENVENIVEGQSAGERVKAQRFEQFLQVQEDLNIRSGESGKKILS